MTFAEALKTALEYEIRVRDVYTDAFERVGNQVAKRVFRALGNEEQQHVEYLVAKMREWQRSGIVTVEELSTVVPAQEVIEQGVAKLQAELTDADIELEVHLLRQALAVEEETSRFYHRVAEELPAGQKELFAGFLTIEDGHLSIVQAELDAVTGKGFWFDFQEFNLSA